MKRAAIALLLLGVVAIAWAATGEKKQGKVRDDDCREAVPYTPSAMEVPLPDDFTRAADKRIGSGNYKKELSRVERELAELADADPMGDEAGAATEPR